VGVIRPDTLVECRFTNHTARHLPASSRFKPDRSSIASLATKGGLWEAWRGKLLVRLNAPRLAA
jgi:hypothetical protein